MAANIVFYIFTISIDAHYSYFSINSIHSKIKVLNELLVTN